MADININNAEFISDYDNPPDPERVIEGLRDTGYDLNTAIADIVDNSIAASATRVDIIFNISPQLDVEVFIADNGIGMDYDGLQNAMKYGSARREDPSSLGKFGLGLKTASTAFCRMLSLVSRGDDNIIRKMQWDLDYVAKHGWKVKQMNPTDDEIDLFEQTAGSGTGTMVIWGKNDRLFMKEYKTPSGAAKAFTRKVESLRQHLSMVYQRFIDHNMDCASNIDIYLNGEQIVPWDPFCVNEPNTERLANQSVNVTLSDGSKSSFHIAAYAIPSTKTYSSTEAEKTAHISIDNSGFYIYRENRLIHSGDWLGMYVKEAHQSLLRVDFSFDHTLDEAFNVDIKKSKIKLNEQIYDFVKSFLAAPRRVADDKYRDGLKKKINNDTKGAHDGSNITIGDKSPNVIDSNVVPVIGGKKDEVNITNRFGTTTGRITIETADDPAKCYVVTKPTLDDGVLWKPAIVNNQHAVQINESHPYYRKIYYPHLAKNNLVIGMDSLLWSFVEAEFATYNEATKEMYEDIRINISRYLKKLLEDLPDPEFDTED